MNSKCDDCKGKCCIGTVDVYKCDVIYNDETLVQENPSRFTGSSVTTYTGACIETPKFDRIMKLVDGHCIALIAGKCSIYDKRPAVCHAFQVDSQCCENIRNGYLNSHTCKFCIVSDALQKAGI